MLCAVVMMVRLTVRAESRQFDQLAMSRSAAIVAAAATAAVAVAYEGNQSTVSTDDPIVKIKSLLPIMGPVPGILPHCCLSTEHRQVSRLT